jgi:hypothetical protein
MRPWQKQISYGLYAAFVAALLAFQPLANRTYVFLFLADQQNEERLQPAIPAGVPIPHNLAWSETTRDIISGIGRLSNAGVLAFEVVLFLILLHTFLRIVNPTFRMTEAIDAKVNPIVRTWMFTPPIIKVFLISVAAALPTFLIWTGLGFVLGSGPFSIYVRSALAGAAAFLLYSRIGLAGDCAEFQYNWPRERKVWASLLARGAVFGLAMAAIGYTAILLNPDKLLRFERALGMIGEPSWRHVAVWICGISALLGLAGAALTVALGDGSHPWVRRVALTVVPLGFLALAHWWSGPVLAAEMQRADYPTMRDDVQAKLKAAAKLDEAKPERRTAFVLDPLSPMSLRAGGMSFSTFPANQSTANVFKDYLKQHNYQTAFGQAIYYTIHDAATYAMRPDDVLQVELDNLQKYPDPATLNAFFNVLSIVGSGAQSRHFVELLADERQFKYDDDKAYEFAAGMAARLGMKEQAASLFKRAKIPASRIESTLSNRVMFANGIVDGQLTIQGKPAAGCRIGLVPLGAFRDLEGSIIPGFGLNLFWLRWVSVAVDCDAQGRFHLEHVVAGHYRLIVMAENYKLRSLTPGLVLKSSNTKFDGDVFLAFGQPKVDVGKLDLSWDPKNVLKAEEPPFANNAPLQTATPPAKKS